MSLKKITLPVSGYLVEINTDPSWGDRKAVENFIVANATGKIGADGVFQSEFSGDVIGKQQEFAMTILVKSISNKDGTFLPPTIETINSLSIEDGELIERCTKEVWDDLKKKSKKTE